MKEFFLNYYKEIIVLFCFVLELVLSVVAIIKKVKKQGSLYTDILVKLPDIISKVEKIIGSGNGSQKLQVVLKVVNDLVVSETGKEMTSSDRKFVSEAIEEILTTPQKKGVS